MSKYYRAKCLVMEKELTIPYEIYALGDNKKEAEKNLRDKVKGMYHVWLDKIDFKERK